MSDRIAQPYTVPAGQPISAAMFYASSFSIQATANDVTVVVHDTLPVSDGQGVDGNTELRRPVAIIKLSPQSAKDLSLVMRDAMQKYEALYQTNLVTELSQDDPE